MKKAYFNLNDKMIEANGVAKIEVTRNNKHELNSWIRYDLKQDTVANTNGIKKTHYIFDEQGQIRNSDLLDLSVNNTYGVLLRSGFDLHELVIRGYDLSKFTIGLEFNYIPKSDVEISTGQVVGTVLTSNVALSIGYSIGIRKD